MKKEDCFELGAIIKPHGLQGDIQAFLDTDNVDLYIDLDSILIEQNGRLVPFFIEELRPQAGNKVLIKFEEINTVEQAERLRKAKLYLPDQLIPPLAEDEFFYHEIIGFTVVDELHGVLGQIETIYNLPQNDLLVVTYKNNEVLIPLKAKLISNLDKDNQQLLMRLPEGLLDVYTQKDDTPEAEKRD